MRNTAQLISRSAAPLSFLCVMLPMRAARITLRLANGERCEAHPVGRHMIHVRTATTADAQSIVRIHFAAVHHTASACYSAEVLRAWSPPPDETRFERVRQALASGE